MCYEGGCAVMTNEVPDIIVDLPTYEQVEDVKNVVVNTGGMMVDTRGKKYKGLMVDWAEFKTVEGSGHSNSIVDSLIKNFPDVASVSGVLAIVMTNPRKRIYGDIYYVTDYKKVIIFINMRTLQTVKAISLQSETLFGAFSERLGCIYDSNYIYIRALYGTTFKWVVFRKNTLEYVTTIEFVASQFGGSSLHYASPTYFTEGFINGHFFVANEVDKVIYSYRINYNASGVPVSYSYRTTSIVAGNNALAKVLWIGSDGFLYSGYSSSSSTFMIDKYSISLDGGISATPVASNNNSVMSNSLMCIFLEKTIINGIPYVLCIMGYGTGSYIYWVNEFTMKIEQVLDSSYFGYTYDSDNKVLATCPNAGIGGIDINGNYFDTIRYSYLNDNKWSNKSIYIPAIRMVNTNSLIRLFELNNRSYFYNGEHYIRFNYKDGCKVIPMDVLYGYKEEI